MKLVVYNCIILLLNITTVLSQNLKTDTIVFKITEKKILFVTDMKAYPITERIYSYSSWDDEYNNIFYGHKKINWKYLIFGGTKQTLNKWIKGPIYLYDTTKIDTLKSYFTDLSMSSDTNTFKKEYLYSRMFNNIGLENISNVNYKAIRIVYPLFSKGNYFNIVTINLDSSTINILQIYNQNTEKTVIKNRKDFFLTPKELCFILKEIEKIKVTSNSWGCQHDYALEHTESLYESNIDTYHCNFICEYDKSDNKEKNYIRKKYRKLLNTIKNISYINTR